MFCYKNISLSVKTFYGISFAPGDIKEVPGPINSKHFVRAKLPKTSKSVSKSKANKAPAPTLSESSDTVKNSEIIIEGGTVNGTDCD